MLIEGDDGAYRQLSLSRPNAICLHAAVCGGRFGTVHWASRAQQQGSSSGASGSGGSVWELMPEERRQALGGGIGTASAEGLPAVHCYPLQYIVDNQVAMAGRHSHFGCASQLLLGRAECACTLARPCHYTQHRLCSHARRFGVHGIDLLTVNVAGAELEVLKGVDFSRLAVKVLAVGRSSSSTNNSSSGNSEQQGGSQAAAIAALLAQAGFEAVPAGPGEQMQPQGSWTVFVNSHLRHHLRQALEA
jgi:hypothetical protein